MTRTLTSAMQTAIKAQTGEFAYLLDMEFSGGTVRFTTAAADIDWGGNTYVALGGLLQIEAVEETSDFAAQSVLLRITGVNTQVIDILLSEGYIGRLATVRLAHFESDGTVTSDPLVVWLGYMNERWEIQEKIDREQSSCEISAQFISPIARFEQTRGIQADLLSHQRHYSTDTFMSHIAATSDLQVKWGVWREIHSFRPSTLALRVHRYTTRSLRGR